ncbi:MAG TPA: type VII secretion protein EccB, partial [Actinoplanes sp.]|nr:type VII secretion protein EccB [Actinoplanes sp.]
KPDGKLHPVLNHASGLLIAGSAQGPAKTVTIKRAALAKRQAKDGVAIGAALGTPGAPDSVPAPADLVDEPWQLCTKAGAPPESVLIVGSARSSGRPLSAPTTGAGAEALFVTDQAQNQYLVYDGHRFMFRNHIAKRMAAFGWTGRQPFAVDTAWINAIPAGPDVEALRLERAGARSQLLDKPIGQLYKAPGPGGTMQWAVALDDGVQYISEFQGRLLESDPSVNAGPTITLDTEGFGDLPVSKAERSPDGQDLFPATVPSLVEVTRSACVTIPDATTAVTAVHVDPALPANVTAAGAVGTVARSVPGTVRVPEADYVSVPFGRGVLAESAASATAPPGSGTISLIVGGMRYPIATADDVRRLGLGTVSPRRMPAGLVALLPTGPVLGAETALNPGTRPTLPPA